MLVYVLSFIKWSSREQNDKSSEFCVAEEMSLLEKRLYTTQSLISIKTLFLLTGHTGNLTPKLLL